MDFFPRHQLTTWCQHEGFRKPVLAGIAGCPSVHMPKPISCWGSGREFLYQEQHTKRQEHSQRSGKLAFLQGISYLLLWEGQAMWDLPALFSGFWHVGTHLCDSLFTTAFVARFPGGIPNIPLLPALLKPLNSCGWVEGTVVCSSPQWEISVML